MLLVALLLKRRSAYLLSTSSSGQLHSYLLLDQQCRPININMYITPSCTAITPNGISQTRSLHAERVQHAAQSQHLQPLLHHVPRKRIRESKVNLTFTLNVIEAHTKLLSIPVEILVHVESSINSSISNVLIVLWRLQAP